MIVPFYSPQELETARLALLAACSATKTVRHRNPDTGRIDYVEAPAWEYRIPAATKVIEFARGKAVATTIVANLDNKVGSDDQRAFFESLATDPSAIAALEDTVGKLKDAARAVKKAKSIEITVRPSLPEKPDSTS